MLSVPSWSPYKMLFISLLLYLNTSSFTYKLDWSLFQANQIGMVQSSTVYSFVNLALIQSTSWLWLTVISWCCLITKLCLTLCDPIDCSPPGSSVYENSQASILEWVAIHFLLQLIFPTQGSNPCLLHLLHHQVDSLPLNHLGSPIISYSMLYYNYVIYNVFFIYIMQICACECTCNACECL